MELPAKQPASTRALALPEIITSIMHQMDMRTLITAQRVCQTWNNLIKSSRSLQQALFFLPDDTLDPTKPRIYNNLLAEIFPSFFPHITSTSTEQTTLTSITFVSNHKPLKKYLQPEASWRQMLTTNPPIRTIGHLSYATGMMGLTWTQQKALPQKHGLRMGTLFEMLISLDRYDWNNSSIWISFGGERPVNAPSELFQTGYSLNADRINEDWQLMLHEMDFVLVSGGNTDCTDPTEVDDPEWVKSDDEVVWEGVVACYEELGVKMSGLPMETYNEGWAMWE
ncbi:uncharacterized protein N7496_003520 [Penicillium cataractarum]|uniref:F-box domain-containing protein n=1 Tax=Penicillium cataractarum TaxID=2100454 RepID=A0A9W9SMM0_9EURO|nr:uncharacterized protein N7496_003520 [Penicillium cataractarum]KAJ5381092.1 hypothetical protein N7496_003520 [Penicillium cataractarum]